MIRWAHARLRITKDSADRGVALLVVIGVGIVMTVLVTTGLVVATSGLRAADTDQDFTASLDAAYAGVQDYVAHLNVDSTYPQYGCASTTFTCSDSAGLAASTSNPAFGVGTGGSWATVPGSGGAASFRYEIDNSTFATGGVVRIRSTGRVGQTTRTVLANIKQSGFIDYLYFTNYETQDPQISGIGGVTSSDSPNCAVYAWAGRSSACTTIQFAARDTLRGPVHSNDTLVICGTTFTSTVTTSNTKAPLYTTPAGCASARTASGSAATVTTSPQLGMPASNSAMQNETRSDLTSNPGCLYTGPTSVTYNSDGTMTVVSPWTRFTNTAATGGSSTPNSGTNPGKCGTPGTATGQLGSSGGARVAQLNANVLYVQSVPTVTTDPNYTPTTVTGGVAALPANFKCFGSDGSTVVPKGGSGSSAGWSFGGTSYPTNNEAPAIGWANGSAWRTSDQKYGAAYGCRDGDVFVQGTVTTQTTIGTDNYTYVTGNIIDADQSSDLLGLVSNGAVLVWNPMTASQRPILTDTGREIDAAVLSVAHTFQVQNYSIGGTRGTLTMFGSIAQQFRGPVATSSSGVVANGYVKNYVYDPLLATVTPPKFLAPSSTSFAVTKYVSVAAAFAADGSSK